MLTVNIADAEKEMRKLEVAFQRITNQIIRLTGQGELMRAIQLMQKAAIIARSLQTIWTMMQVGMGPAGWLTLGLTGVSTAISMYETGSWINDLSSTSRGY